MVCYIITRHFKLTWKNLLMFHFSTLLFILIFTFCFRILFLSMIISIPFTINIPLIKVANCFGISNLWFLRLFCKHQPDFALRYMKIPICYLCKDSTNIKTRHFSASYMYINLKNVRQPLLKILRHKATKKNKACQLYTDNVI